MNKDTLIEMIDRGLSTHKIAKELNKSQCAVRHWLKKYGLKTTFNKNSKGNVLRNTKLIDAILHLECTQCKQYKEMNKNNFYIKPGNVPYSYCKVCSDERTIKTQRNRKQQCIDYKGGKCVVCGYNKCNGALDFHHIDPTKKIFNIARQHTYSFKILKPELDKCVLLCKNCHCEYHLGLITLPNIE